MGRVEPFETLSLTFVIKPDDQKCSKVGRSYSKQTFYLYIFYCASNILVNMYVMSHNPIKFLSNFVAMQSYSEADLETCREPGDF